MMLKKKSNPWMKGKALYILPVACIALSAFATPELNEQIESVVETSAVSRDKVTKVPSHPQVSDAKNAVNDTISKVAIVNPDGIVIREAKDGKGDPLFLIDGKESTSKDVKALNPADIESVNVYKDAASLSLFGEKGKNGVIEIKTKGSEDVEPAFEVVEKKAEYKGGITELMNFIAQNIRYPKEAQELEVTGRVIVDFVVEKDGSIHEIKVEHNSAKPDKASYAVSDGTEAGHGYATQEEADAAFENAEAAAKLLEKEALRVVMLTSGSWNPGEQRGKKVRVRYHIPLTFRLN